MTWFRSRPRKEDPVRLRPSFPCKAPIRTTTDDVYEFSESDVGEGTFSQVLKLRRRCDGEVFALKIFKLGLTSPMQVQAEFYVARGMRHRNIIETYDLLNFRGCQGILMEYAPRCLLDIISSSALKPGDSELYLSQLLAGTAYIHKLDFAHRDLKLENVVIGNDGQAKIVDFGSVCTTKPARPANTGSQQYMAPEMFNTQALYDPQLADLWALAIIYICMVVGRFPWAIACLYNPTFKAYAAADRQTIPALEDRSYPYPLSAASSEVRPLLRGMLRVQPSHRIGVAKALEKASKWNSLHEASWNDSIDTLIQ